MEVDVRGHGSSPRVEPQPQPSTDMRHRTEDGGGGVLLRVVRLSWAKCAVEETGGGQKVWAMPMAWAVGLLACAVWDGKSRAESSKRLSVR
jgi:hypothetical protein